MVDDARGLERARGLLSVRHDLWGHLRTRAATATILNAASAYLAQLICCAKAQAATIHEAVRRHVLNLRRSLPDGREFFSLS